MREGGGRRRKQRVRGKRFKSGHTPAFCIRTTHGPAAEEREFTIRCEMLQVAKDGSMMLSLTEQRMEEQMAILDKFYERYDSQQWGEVLEMENEVLEVAREMRHDLTVMRVAGGIYGSSFRVFA